MASCKTSRWVSTAPYVKLTVTETSSTATTSTLTWELQYISDYPVSSDGSRDYTVKIAGSTVEIVKSGTYDINRVTGTNIVASGTKVITKTHAAQSISFSVSFNMNITWSGSYKGTVTASGSMSIAKKTSYTIGYNANGGSGAPSAQTKWHGETLTLSSTKPTKSGYTFMGWGVSTTDTAKNYDPGGSFTANQDFTLYAVWQKTITLSYNANGGTGAPSSQSATVYNATTSNTFTVSSTKPTRTGYTFLGWNTSSSATSASYSEGDSITLSANGTLYAVWRLNVFTVTYNANGGSGAPSAQTKTYGTDLKLASTVPTRKYYTFKGWATSSSGSVVYSAGGTYKNNANITLYAVWEVAYIIPRITGVSVTRCVENGDPQDDGTYALVKFNWATDEDVSAIKIYWKASTDASYGNNIGVAATGRSGSVSQVVGGGAFSEDFAYNLKIEVADNTDRNSATQTLSATLFPIDLLRGGKGVTIGGPAKEEGFHVKMDTNIEGILKASNLGVESYPIASNLSETGVATSVSGHFYILKPFNLVFVRMYVAGFTEAISASSSSAITLCTIGTNFRPADNTPLIGHSVKDVNVLLNTSGNIRIVPRDGFATSNDLYISGVYPLSSNSAYYE